MTFKKNNLTVIFFLFFYGTVFSQCVPGSDQSPEEDVEKPAFTQSDVFRIHTRASNMDRLHSLLILKNDSLIYENYYNQFTKEDYSNIKSASKSLLNLLIGIALEKGYIQSIDQPIYEFLPELFSDTTDIKKKDITIKHLMLMQSGLKPTSLDNYGPWVASEDWLQYAIDQPLEAAPGQIYGYSTGDTHLLATVLARAAGTKALAFAEKYLYGPMDINIQEWSEDPKGNNEGGNNVYIKPIDLAKVGIMVRNGGVYEGKQLVPKKWIEESISNQVAPQGISRPFDIDGYGYLWWLVKARGYATYSAIGFGGQYMMTIPELDMIIVVTSQSRGSAPGSHFSAIADLIENHILLSFD